MVPQCDIWQKKAKVLLCWEKREPSGATTAAPPSQPQHWRVTLRTQLWMHLHLHQAPLALWSYARWTFFSSMRDNVKHQQIMAKSCILNTYISATDADEILYVFIPVHPMTDVWHWDFSCIWSDLLHPVLLFCRCTCHCSAGISSFYVVCKSIDRLDGSYRGYILTVKHCNELHWHNERGCITARR